jgi:hypothetical protein
MMHGQQNMKPIKFLKTRTDIKCEEILSLWGTENSLSLCCKNVLAIFLQVTSVSSKVK